MRERAIQAVGRAIGFRPAGRAGEGMALVVSLISGLPKWKPLEKAALARVLEAKSSREETRYLHEMQKHLRLRAAVLELGSEEVAP